MDSLLKDSNDIIAEAVKKYKPYATVLMLSGGDDSLTALEVCRVLDIKLDYILHGITNTGLKDTTEHVRKVIQNYDAKYIEANAESAYEDYVLRKGFFGTGLQAHSYAYHLLKNGPFRSTISKHIRKRRRNKNILLINGARKNESENRKNHLKIYKHDPAIKRNIWVNIIHYWSKLDTLKFLKDQNVKRCNAAIYCHRSGECMCGTTQSLDEAEELAFFFPEWKEWWCDIRKRVMQKHPWDWGERTTKKVIKRKIKDTPACSSCVSKL